MACQKLEKVAWNKLDLRQSVTACLRNYPSLSLVAFRSDSNWKQNVYLPPSEPVCFNCPRSMELPDALWTRKAGQRIQVGGLGKECDGSGQRVKKWAKSAFCASDVISLAKENLTIGSRPWRPGQEASATVLALVDPARNTARAEQAGRGQTARLGTVGKGFGPTVEAKDRGSSTACPAGLPVQYQWRLTPWPRATWMTQPNSRDEGLRGGNRRGGLGRYDDSAEAGSVWRPKRRAASLEAKMVEGIHPTSSSLLSAK